MAKTVFADGDIVTKTGGTRVLAAWLNKVFSHRHDGADADGSAPLDYAEDTGAVNALVAALAPALAALVVGMPFGIRVGNTNTGATTLNLNGLGALPVHKLGGAALAAGDIQATQIVRFAYDGAAFQILSYNSPPSNDTQTVQGQSAAMLAPPGALVPFGMASVPTGWLLCDGRAVLRATYAALYAAIGTTWGAGDNVSTFNLPDLRGEFLRGSDNGRGVDAGRAIASFQADGLKQHQHYVANYDFNASPAGTELTNNNTLMVSGNTHAEQGYTLNGSNTVATRGLSSETGGPETRPRNIAVLYCIKY